MSENEITPEARQLELNLRIRNLMRLFLDYVRDYEHENKEPICQDERGSLEFVDIFLESEDAFDYNEILKSIHK